MSRPEITWSLPPTPLAPEYVRTLCRHAKRYAVDSFEICGEYHSPYAAILAALPEE